MDRYRSASTTHPEISAFVLRLDEQFEEWADLLFRGQLDDALNARDKKDKDFFINRTRKEFASLKAAASRGRALSGEEDNAVFQQYAPSFGILAQLERYGKVSRLG